MSLPGLTLNEMYSRKEVFASVGIVFSTRNQHQIKGLSPRCPDGGYFIFITLDKSTLGQHQFDYEDELFNDRVAWVTQRGAQEHHTAYEQLRAPSTRVSLFARLKSRDGFMYLGEISYVSHTQSGSGGTGQQVYVFSLQLPISDAVLLQLLCCGGRSQRQSTPQQHSTQRPRTLGGLKHAFSYALNRTSREVNPCHHNYQIRLREYLAAKGVSAAWERDHIDVEFSFGSQLFIGEIKTTNYLTPEEAFRIAIGQILFYAETKYDKRPSPLVMFDCEVDKVWVALASRLGIGVVSEQGTHFVLCNPNTLPGVAELFER